MERSVVQYKNTRKAVGLSASLWSCARIGQGQVYRLPRWTPELSTSLRGSALKNKRTSLEFISGANVLIMFKSSEPVGLEISISTSALISGNISAVFTFKWKGEELARLVDAGTKVYVQISVATHCTRPSAHINR